MTSIHQQFAGQVNNWADTPTEPFEDLHADGLRVVHLRVDARVAGAVTTSWARRLKTPATGRNIRIIATINPDTMFADQWPYVDRDNPIAVADFLSAEMGRIGAYGADVNAEDYIEAKDQGSKGAWSQNFLNRFRWHRPGAPLYLNTFTGAGYIDLPAWEAKAARMHIQQHDVGEPMARSVQALYDFAKFYGWKQISKVKPQIGCFRREDKSGLDLDAFVSSCKAASPDPVGVCAYYLEGSFGPYFNDLRALVQRCIKEKLALV